MRVSERMCALNAPKWGISSRDTRGGGGERSCARVAEILTRGTQKQIRKGEGQGEAS